MVLICIALTSADVEHLFICLSTHLFCMPYLEKSSSIFVTIYIFWVQISYMICKYFLTFYGLSFCFLVGVIWSAEFQFISFLLSLVLYICSMYNMKSTCTIKVSLIEETIVYLPPSFRTEHCKFLESFQSALCSVPVSAQNDHCAQIFLTFRFIFLNFLCEIYMLKSIWNINVQINKILWNEHLCNQHLGQNTEHWLPFRNL